MRLIVQIPCYNEESTLARTLGNIPRRIAGIDRSEVLVVDDGSRDGTIRVARCEGADHIVRHQTHRGLAAAFMTGVEACLARGADIIVNTDGDNQYCGSDIPVLVEPILRRQADIVIGDRRVWSIRDFSLVKKILQTIGSTVVRRLSHAKVADAPSGFRAMTREAALQVNLLGSYSHTLETVFQVSNKGLSVVSVPIRTNGKMRESRLVCSIPQYVVRSLGTILRCVLMYHPLRLFSAIGVLMMLGGLAATAKAVFLLFGDQAMAQLAMAGAGLILFGLLSFMLGLLADLIAVNRRLLEMTLEKLRRVESDRREQAMSGERSLAQEWEEVAHGS